MSRLRASVIVIMGIALAQVTDIKAEPRLDCNVRVNGLCQYVCDAPEGLACITYYTDTGITYSGVWTYEEYTDHLGNVIFGVVACSWNIPLYSFIYIHSTGKRYVCLDRGRLGYRTWVDVYISRHDRGIREIANVYGPYAEVSIELPIGKNVLLSWE